MHMFKWLHHHPELSLESVRKGCIDNTTTFTLKHVLGDIVYVLVGFEFVLLGSLNPEMNRRGLALLEELLVSEGLESGRVFTKENNTATLFNKKGQIAPVSRVCFTPSGITVW